MLNKEYESMARSIREIDDIKECLIKFGQEIDTIEWERHSDKIDNIKIDLDLLAEKVSNIEMCLVNNRKKINIEDLRL